MRISTIRSSTAHPVTVNGALIANADIAREVQNHPDESPRQAWDAAARALIVRHLLAQRAQALCLTATPRSVDGQRETEEEALIRVLLEAEVRTPTADDATCLRYYQANPARFRTSDLYEPAHILFQAPRDDAEAYATAERRAEAVLQALKTEPDRLDAFARFLSDCPSATEGGRLGQITLGETTPAFEAAMVTMEAGRIHPAPVRTPYGVHVVRLDRKVAGAMPPFEQVRDRIARYLEERSWRRAVAQYVSLLAGQARIEGFDMQGASSPLVR